MTKAEISKLFWEEVCCTPNLQFEFEHFLEIMDGCCRSWSDHLEEDGSLSEYDYSYEYGFDDGSILVFQYDIYEDGFVESNCEVLK